MIATFYQKDFDYVMDKLGEIEKLYGKPFIFIHRPCGFNIYKIDHVIVENVPFEIMVEKYHGVIEKINFYKTGIRYGDSYIDHEGRLGNKKTIDVKKINKRSVNHFKRIVESLQEAVQNDKLSLEIRKGE